MNELISTSEPGMARTVIRRFFKHKLAGIAIALLTVLILASTFAFASPYIPTDLEPTNSFQKTTAGHWFGTDELGRDIFTRILYGGRVSLTVGLLSTFISIALGIVVGALSGYFGGWTDSILMRITDAFLTFPTIFVLIILGAFLREQQVPWLKNSVIIVIIIIAALSWMWPARLSLELQGYTAYDPLQLSEEFVVENLKAVGVEARIQNYDFSIIFGTYEDNSPRMLGDYDMLIFDRGFTTEPQGYVADAYSSTTIPSPENTTGGNYFRWVNPDVDAALEKAGGSFDTETRKKAYCEVGQAVIDDMPQVYLYLFQDGYGIADSMTGYTGQHMGLHELGRTELEIQVK